MSTIEPKLLKGFRDFAPDVMLTRQRLLTKVRAVFERFGFAPVETASLEYSEIVLGKYGGDTEKQVYRFLDNGKRDVCMRFELTGSLARFIAMNRNLPRPLKCYHIGNVWRAENPGRGRFREFLQCDVDIIGAAGLPADAECVAVGVALLETLGVRAVMEINNRKVFRGLQEALEIDDNDRMAAAIRAIDKLAKIGLDGVRKELTELAGFNTSQTDRVAAFLMIDGDNDKKLAELDRILAASHLGRQGVAEIREVLRLARALGVTDAAITVNPSLARGADYYTGTVFEANPTDLPGFGSVMGGGRYDDLIGMFMGEQVPAVGISLGFDRLLVALEELGRLEKMGSPTQVLATVFAPELAEYSFTVTAKLRAAGINAEAFLDTGAKLRKQLAYASDKGIPLVIIAGPDEQKNTSVTLRDMEAGGQSLVTLDALVEAVRARLGSSAPGETDHRSWNWPWQPDVIARVPKVSGLYVLRGRAREALDVGFAGKSTLAQRLADLYEERGDDVASFDWYELADEGLGNDLAAFLTERMANRDE